MKNHVVVENIVDIAYISSVEELIGKLQAASEGILHADIRLDWAGYDGYSSELIISGYRPMTEEELEAAKEQRKRERAQRKAAKEKALEDKKQLFRKLAAEFGVEAVDAHGTEI